MSKRVKQAILRIMLLLEDFSPDELREAVSHVAGRRAEDLLAFLNHLSGGVHKARTHGSKSASAAGQGHTHAVAALRHADPDKYQLLAEFEARVRNGEILATLDDFRSIGKLLGKEFQPGKSRKEALGRLMAVLAHMDLDSIGRVIRLAPADKGRADEAYQRLADRIIRGPGDPEKAP
jgi:hypothetical protein